MVSFEVTDACTCWCKHCDHGGPRDESRNLKPADYRRYMEALRPCVVQVSGGEPLMRGDVVEIVRSIKNGSTLPYTILVSNWSHMTREKYLALREAGIDQFSVSLDFPDQRHDDFRVYPGLYSHLEDLIPQLAKLGHDDIVLNSCITSENLGEIEAIADKAREWGVNLCYSAYSARRTGCRDYFPGSAEQLAELNARLDRVEQRRDATNWIVNSSQHTRRYTAVLRQRRQAGVQSGTALPGGDRRRRAAALLHAVPALRTGRARADDRRVYGQQPVRRMLRLDPLLP